MPQPSADADTHAVPTGPHEPGAWRPDLLDAAFAGTFAALAAASWIAIVLAEAGRFDRRWLLAVAAPAALAAAVAVWRSIGAGRPRPSRAAALSLAAVLLATATLASRPGEYLVDGSDGSVYLNIGRALARHGALVYGEPVLDLIPASEWDAVLVRELHPPRVYNLFPGGIQVRPGVNAVQPNFFHLLPVWIGAADLLLGPRAAYYVPPLAGLLALAAFWLLVRAVTASTFVSTLTAALLLANFVQGWFSRLPTTEVLTQALITSGLFFATWCHRRPHAAPGVLAAAAFGLAAFARIDVLMFVSPLVAGFLVLIAVDRRWARPWTWCAALLAALTAHAAAHAWLLSGPYTERIVHFILTGRNITTATRVVPPLVIAAGVLALVLARIGRLPALVSRATVVAFVLLLGTAIVRLWPQLTGGHLAMVVTPAGLALALAGTLLWLSEDRSPPTLLAVGLLLISALVYGESARDQGTMPMVLRRYVPVVLPLAVLTIGVLVHRAGRRGAVARAIAVVAVAALAVTWGARARPLLAAPMRGVHDQMARIAEAIPADAIVVTDRTTPSHFGLSLHASFGRDVLWVRPTPATAGVLTRLAGAGRPFVVALGRTGDAAQALTARDMVGLDLAPPRVETLHLTQIEGTSSRMPSALTTRTDTIDLYAATARRPGTPPLTLEIGEADLGARIDGFHDAERMGDASARWTRDLARIQLPALATGEHAAIALHVAAPRPADMAAPVARIDIDGCDVGATPPLTSGFSVVEVPLPPSCAARLASGATVLTIQSPVFVPAEHGFGADTRQLGVVVDWVRVTGR